MEVSDEKDDQAPSTLSIPMSIVTLSIISTYLRLINCFHVPGMFDVAILKDAGIVRLPLLRYYSLHARPVAKKRHVFYYKKYLYLRETSTDPEHLDDCRTTLLK